MDASEILALEFLRSYGMTDIIYEPNGNVPPDFSCAGKIAVEVRRLNQHDVFGRGLEEVSIPLSMKLRRLLASLGPPQEASWFVAFRYHRPLEAWTTLGPKISDALIRFQSNPNERPVRLTISERLEIGLVKSSALHTSCFVPGVHCDHDSGGWITSETIKNLTIIISEKSKKVKPFLNKYGEWWLVLPDHIGYARLENHELDTLREHVVRPPEWSKIILVNPLSPQQGIEL